MFTMYPACRNDTHVLWITLCSIGLACKRRVLVWSQKSQLSTMKRGLNQDGTRGRTASADSSSRCELGKCGEAASIYPTSSRGFGWGELFTWASLFLPRVCFPGPFSPSLFVSQCLQTSLEEDNKSVQGMNVGRWSHGLFIPVSHQTACML